ncbi:hypothetical protein E2C01_001494 [Portunus trituberculatus]|uniref:Uncharacterized protein n=1 Tax=Portunus trituberculatus TaxID=210409 RepID=A0A5B7CHF1_PORTR|nr:hypothetical protein [Portunus trituberculatus]
MSYPSQCFKVAVEKDKPVESVPDNSESGDECTDQEGDTKTNRLYNFWPLQYSEVAVEQDKTTQSGYRDEENILMFAPDVWQVIRGDLGGDVMN